MFDPVRIATRPDPQRLAGLARRCPPLAFAALLLLTACALPRNTALRDWAQTASLATEAARVQEDGPRAMQQALARYLGALSIRAGDGDLVFRPAAFAPLAAQAGLVDAAAGQAVADLGAVIAANDGPQPYFDPSRLAAMLRGADAPVQVLVARLGPVGATPAAAAPPEPAAADPAAVDPAAWRALRDQARADQAEAAAAAAARARYVRVLHRIGQDHAMITALAGVITQRETERRIMAAEDQLRRAMAMLPPAP